MGFGGPVVSVLWGLKTPSPSVLRRHGFRQYSREISGFLASSTWGKDLSLVRNATLSAPAVLPSCPLSQSRDHPFLLPFPPPPPSAPRGTTTRAHDDMDHLLQEPGRTRAREVWSGQGRLVALLGAALARRNRMRRGHQRCIPSARMCSECPPRRSPRRCRCATSWTCRYCIP